jgi:hypothetical protein
MTTRSVSEALSADLAHRTEQAAKAALLLRNAADRIDGAGPDESRNEQAARLRGSSILALTGALELAACSGWIEALATVEAELSGIKGGSK